MAQFKIEQMKGEDSARPVRVTVYVDEKDVSSTRAEMLREMRATASQSSDFLRVSRA